MQLVTIISLLVVFIFFPATIVFSGNESLSRQMNSTQGEVLKVQWTVSSYLHVNPSVMPDVEANKLLFQPLHIDASSITFMDNSCRNVSFHRETVDTLPYLADRFRITPENLDYDQSKLTVIRTDCHLEGFSEYIHLADRRLVIPIKGTLFIFTPAVDF